MKIKKVQVKILLDLIMLVLMLLEFSAQFTQNKIHEIIGITLAILFIVHNLLNWNWYASIFKGKYNLNRIIMLIVNIALAISMIITIASSLPISRTIFTFLPINGNMGVRKIHTASAYWSLIFMAIHFGIHFNLFRGMIKNKIDRKWLKVCSYIVQIIIILYGMKLFIATNVYQQLIAYYTFGSWKDGTMINDIFNNTVMMLAISFITHNILKIIRRNRKNEK